MRQDTLHISTKRLGRILYCGSWKRQILHLYFFFSIDSSLIRSQATGFLICKVFSCFLRSFRVEQIFLSWHRSEERSVADLIEHDFAVLIASKLQETILNCLKFSQLGAIQIEKEIRLVLLSLSMLLPGAKVRELFSRVLTIAALLNTETSEDSSYVDAASLFLPFELERIAMLRTDF